MPATLCFATSTLPAVRVHEEQLVREGHVVLATELVEATQRRVPQRLWPAGVQRHAGPGLDLEPADDLEHAAVGAVRHEDRLWRPATTAVPGQHLDPGRGENASPIARGFDLVLVYVDVLGSQPVEQLSAVHAIELVQHVAHQVTHVAHRPVDVEHHEQVILWVSDAAVDIVPGQAAHPIRHPSEPFVPGRLAVAVVPLSIAGNIAQLHALWRNHTRSVR
jgi:hypothetical protein